MIESLSIPVLLLIFVVSAMVIWFAGIKLSETADILAIHFGFGEALGGLILLAIVTNLPEIAITVSAALQNNLELAIGNILGGIAILYCAFKLSPYNHQFRLKFSILLAILQLKRITSENV